MKIWICLFILLAPAISYSETACKTTKWATSRNLPITQIKQKLDTVPRSTIVQMAWWEIVNQSTASMAGPILQYLAGTEQDSLLRGYYKSMHAMITPGLTPEDAIQTWPRRPASRKSIYTLMQLCELYKKSNGK